MIGTVLDKYEVLQKVGEGGMATVYRGRHTTLDRNVAIKVLHPHLSSSTRNRKRFAREARAIEHLRHENILEIFDYSGTECGDCYIITEFVNGQTLTELMEHCGRVPSEVAALVGLSLARALEYAHDSGILHRDLKPDNVMLRVDGTVKLMDFGIARFLDETQVTLTGALVGSPAFMSPEQARESDLDPRSDLFSLGTLLFYLVAGHLPFSGSNPSLILKNIIEGERLSVTEVAPTMSAKLADVIEHLLERDREQRTSSAAAVIEALGQCLDEVEIRADAPEWGLARFCEDTKAYELRLEAYLKTALVVRGQAYLDAGNHIEALRVFNRVLSLDEDNGEVLALVQGLHGEAESKRRHGSLAVAAGIAMGLAAVAATVLWLVGRHDAVSRLPETAGVVSEQPALQPSVSGTDDTSEPDASSVAPVPTAPALVEKTPRREHTRVSTPAVLPSLVRPPVSAALIDERAARVTFQVVGDGWADVYCDKKRVGKTRPPENEVELPPGTHRCRYASPYILDEPVEFTVAPGESHVVAVPVRPKPLVVAIDLRCAEACVVARDGLELGTVSSMSRTLQIDRPGDSHTVQLTCPNGVFSMQYNGTARPFICLPP